MRRLFKFMSFKLISLVLLVLLLIAGAGLVWLAFFRSNTVHYHANFAVYIHGQRLPFKEFYNYEELSACSNDYKSDPESRVHMHNYKSDLIHVHDQAVTYQHFFLNLGMNLGNEFLQDSQEKLFIDGENGSLRFILNGKPVKFINNKLIVSEDKLLVDFSNDDLETLLKRYQTIPDTAVEANHSFDPGGCGSKS